jgi:hypothetical protein
MPQKGRSQGFGVERDWSRVNLEPEQYRVVEVEDDDYGEEYYEDEVEDDEDDYPMIHPGFGSDSDFFYVEEPPVLQKAKSKIHYAQRNQQTHVTLTIEELSALKMVSSNPESRQSPEPEPEPIRSRKRHPKHPKQLAYSSSRSFSAPIPTSSPRSSQGQALQAWTRPRGSDSGTSVSSLLGATFNPKANHAVKRKKIRKVVDRQKDME